MIKKCLIIALTVSISICPSLTVSGQQDPQQSEDQKIEALKKRQLELKRQIREELERQNKALEEELNQLKLGSTKPKTTDVSTPASVANNDNVATPGPSAPASASTQGNGNGNAIGIGPTVISTSAVVPAASVPRTTTSSAPQASSSQTTDCALIIAAPRNFSRADQAVCFLARNIINRRIDNVGSPGIDPTTEDMSVLLPAILAQLAQPGRDIAVDAAVKSFVLDIEASRTDKQFGADSRSAGTTSLGVKGGIPQVLSWAVENGGAVSSIDGTTVTFRVNPVGFIQALSGQGYITGFRNTEDDALARFFRRTSVGFSFDTKRDTDPPTLTGSKQQLSAVSVRYQLVNQRDPRAGRYREMWDTFFQQQGVAFTNQQTEQLMKLQVSSVGGGFKNQALQDWLNTTNVSLNGTRITPSLVNKNEAIEEVRKIIDQRLAQLPAVIANDAELTGALSNFVAAYLPYLAEKKRIMDEIAKGTLVTFEYTNYREPNAPDLSNFRFVFDKGTLGGMDFNANASLTFFNKRPVGPNVQRIRDFDFSAQLDKKLEDVMGLGPATLSFTGKFQRLTSNAIAFDGTVLPNTKGDIAAGQVKLTIPIKDSGIKVPFSITFANRSELVREKEVRGNFGFSFDLDTLFARFKSFSQ